MKLINRMIFGTARLAGGGCARTSRQLIEDCCAAGLTRFDTAPSYGMGAAERLLGEVLDGDTGAKIHTKAGMPAPAGAALRGWAKRLQASLGANRVTPWKPELLDYRKPASTGRYSKSELLRSIECSHEFLRRETLDMLLLHAAEPDDIPADSWEVFINEQSNGRADNIGYAHTGPVKAGRDDCIVQIAPRTAEFCTPSVERRIFHSIRTSAAIAKSQGDEASSALLRTRDKLSCRTDDATADILAAMVLLADRHPNSTMIFATTSRARLSSILAEAAAIDLPDLTA